MILHHKGLNINNSLIKFKKGFKYSENISFIPIHYNKKELLIQSPNMYIPFDIINYKENNKQYLDLTFQNSSDKETCEFLKNIYSIFDCVKNHYRNFIVQDFIKERGPYKWMRFKLSNQSLFFNQQKEKLMKIPSKVFGVFIISLNGLWLIDNKLWFNWSILQSKLYIPTTLKEYYFLEEEECKENDTPPPPPPPQPFFIKKKLSIKDQISKNKSNGKQHKNKTDNFTPSIDELLNALKSLNKAE